MKEKNSNIQAVIYRYLQQSEEEGKSYAYEIIVEGSNQSVLVAPRTNNIEAFKSDMTTSKEIAGQLNGIIKINIYRGKSPKAGLISNYEIELEHSDGKENSITNQMQLEQVVENVMQKHKLANNSGLMGNLESINMLFGALTGNNNEEKGGNALNGLAGLLGAVNNSRQENTLMQFEKKLSDFKQETHINSLQKQLDEIITERDTLKQQNEELGKANGKYKLEVSDLETKLVGYSNTEILKRVATGVISGIGSKLLGGSPKVAELLGLTKDELQSALGIVQEDALPAHSITSNTDVDIEELATPKTEQEQQIFKAIDNTSEALKKGDINFAYYMITIIGNCMDNRELTDSMVHHLEKEKQRLSLEKNIENNTEEQ